MIEEEWKTDTELPKQSSAFPSRAVRLEPVGGALRVSDEKWRFLLKNTADVILNLNRDGTILFINHTVPGYTVEDIVGKTIYDFIPPEQHKKTRNAIAKVFQTGEAVDFETSIIRPDGSLLLYSTRLGPVKNGDKIVGVTQISTDITERKKTEEVLRDSESKYRTLVENLPQKIFLKDKNSVYVSCNDNLARDLKIKREEIAGKTDYDLVPKELAEKYRADDKRIIKSGQTEAIEEKYIQQGEERIIHTVKTPVKDEQGNVIGVLGIFWDITELKRREEELNLYREKIARAEQLASVGTLSATVAHELTQPLTVMRLSIENALAKLATTSSAATVMKNIKDSLTEVSNITSIVERFRNYARRSSKTIAGEVDLKAVAERTVQLLSESARQARVTLRLEGMDKLPPVYSSEKDVEQLFFALIENAVQASDGKKNRRLIIGGDVQDGHIELRFSDNCGGIAPENLDRIFEPFFTTRPAGEGTGLGLCVVQRIILEAGGKVRVESKAGKGTTFFITLHINKGKES